MHENQGVQGTKVIFLTVACATLLCACSARPNYTLIGNPNVQASIASSTMLSTVSASDPTLSSAIDVTNADAVSALAGGVASVKGTLSRIEYPKSATSNLVLFFQGGDDSTTRATVPGTLFSQLPDLSKYVGKDLLVTGNVTMGRQVPSVVATAANSIKLIQ